MIEVEEFAANSNIPRILVSFSVLCWSIKKNRFTGFIYINKLMHQALVVWVWCRGPNLGPTGQAVAKLTHRIPSLSFPSLDLINSWSFCSLLPAQLPSHWPSWVGEDFLSQTIECNLGEIFMTLLSTIWQKNGINPTQLQLLLQAPSTAPNLLPFPLNGSSFPQLTWFSH